MQRQNEFKLIRKTGRLAPALAPGLAILLFFCLLKFIPRAGATQVTAMDWNLVGSLEAGRCLHTATLLQNGKVLIAGGIGARGSSEIPLNSAELYDPATGAWSRTDPLGTPRISHTAVLLTNGKVLVAGGASRIDPASGNLATPLNSAEIYDPDTGGWTPAGSFSGPRGTHTATLLRDGRVMIAGGALENVDSTASVEIYDPSAGTWSAAANLNLARSAHAVALLSDGRVMVAGGFGNNRVLDGAEIYDPNSRQWTRTGALRTARFYFSATALPNGQVLVAGGGADPAFDSFQGTALNSAELYNPGTGTWTGTKGNLMVARGFHGATLLPNGKVLVSGGLNRLQSNVTVSAEIYDPATGMWDGGGGQLNTPRFLHTITLLASGHPLAVGGINSATILIDRSAEVFAALAIGGVWNAAGSLGTRRGLLPNALSSDHTATLLPDGRIMVAGGTAPLGALNTVDLYDPSNGTWTLAPKVLTQPRRQHTATSLSNGKVLLTGGVDSRGLTTSTAEVYDPGSGGLRTANDLGRASRLHTATLLADGRVLIAGGETENSIAQRFGANVFGRSVPTAVILNRAEVYDPAMNRWSATGPLAQSRSGHAAVLLPNGKVLVMGGSDSRNLATATAELYDPASGTWTPIGSLTTARRLHTATLLPNGKVLVAGGEVSANTPTDRVEIYDPATGAWSAGGTLRSARYLHTATLLLNGQVLVAGGSDGGSSIRMSEIYDPAVNLWGTGGAISPSRYLHTATLLQTGRVMIVGGVTNPGGTVGAQPLDDAELFDGGSPIFRKPSLTGLPPSLVNQGKLSVTGSGFAGSLEASSGNAQSSASNYPLLQLRSLANDQTRYLLPDPASRWSDTTFTSQAVTGFPRGQALVSVVSNGVASDARSLVIGCAAITLSPAVLPDATLCAPYSQTITASGGTPPYSYNFIANTFPPGLRPLSDPNGITISGAPLALGRQTITIFATDVNGCSVRVDYPLLVNPPVGAVKLSPTSTSFAQTDPRRSPNSSPSSQCITIENTSCGSLSFRLDSIVRVGDERISNESNANDWRSAFDSNDRRPYSAILALPGATEISLTPSQPFEILAGGTVRICLLFDPLIPRRATGTANLSTQQVLPDQIASQVRFMEGQIKPLSQTASQPPIQFNFTVSANLNPLVKLIHPSDPSLPPQVTLGRAGDAFEVNLAVYDPNMDLYLIRYQFLDSSGRQVEPNIDVDMAETIGRSGLARGQSFGLTQRFQGASQRPDVARVRVIVYDRTGDESAVSVPASGSSVAANSRSMEPRGVTLELPARTLAPRPATTRAVVRDPQPATRRRRR